ncbi:MAG: response regulator [Chloroflexota bacterium]|nr:response regulator [Chloroflexota bacterium]
MGAQLIHLMVVDDEPMIRELCVDMLAGEGYDVITASNGREAVDLATSRRIDLVLMDIMMPVLDGLTACKMMHEDSRTRNLPVVIMSAAGNVRERMRDVQCLAAAILPKPFDFDELLQTVRYLTA